MTDYPPPTGAAPIPPSGHPPVGGVQPTKKNFFGRHKILSALLVVVAVVVVIAIATGGDGDAGSTPSTASTGAAGSAKAPEPTKAPEPEKAPGLNTPVRDGKFEFTVTKVETGVPQIGTEPLTTKAQGQFILVHTTVQNIGDEAQLFSASDQTLIDQDGKRLSADSGAAIYLEDANSLLEQINPGNTVQGILVFDAPVTAVPTTLELHDSAFSGGVTVALG